MSQLDNYKIVLEKITVPRRLSGDPAIDPNIYIFVETKKEELLDAMDKSFTSFSHKPYQLPRFYV
jgi:hypothetical protein